MKDKQKLQNQSQAKGFGTASPDTYDRLSISLHWITAILVVVLYLLAEAWEFLEKGTPPRHALQALHVSLGLVLTVVIAVRIPWRVLVGRRLPQATPGLLGYAATAVHYLLYLLLIVQIVLGFVFRWAQDEALSFFGLFTIPSPFVFSTEQRHNFGELHETIGTLIIVIAAGHMAAALFHYYVFHDPALEPTDQKRLKRICLSAKGFRKTREHWRFGRQCSRIDGVKPGFGFVTMDQNRVKRGFRASKADGHASIKGAAHAGDGCLQGGTDAGLVAGDIRA